jgi:hypothetical protein
MRTQKQIKLKDGTILPKGLPVSFNQDTPHLCLVRGERLEPYKIRITSAFNVPSMDELNEMASDSICQSVLGENVEPDGFDENNSPSWLLALQLI